MDIGAVKMKILKIEISRGPARDRRENRARFIPNDKRKKHIMLLCPSIFLRLHTYWCPN
jgi:hypothetical protein